MSVFMRAVLTKWDSPPLLEAARFVAKRGPFRIQSHRDDWSDFEVTDAAGAAVLAGDLWIGEAAREELAELEEFLDDLVGSESARETIRGHLQRATAIVGMQVLMARYDESVAAANVLIEFLEQRPGTLTQVDTVGWYDGPDLILTEPE